jgi:glucose-6-phosphate 1-dehydrogenase
MDSKLCTVRIQFKSVEETVPKNELVIRIQPDPAIWLKLNVKEPGLGKEN